MEYILKIAWEKRRRCAGLWVPAGDLCRLDAFDSVPINYFNFIRSSSIIRNMLIFKDIFLIVITITIIIIIIIINDVVFIIIIIIIIIIIFIIIIIMAFT